MWNTLCVKEHMLSPPMYPSLMLASMLGYCCDVALVGRCYGTVLCCYALC